LVGNGLKRQDWLASRAVGRVSGLPEKATDTEVASGVDCGREECRLAFHLSVEAGEIGLVEHLLNFFGVGIGVQNSWKYS
jgi:hypothetical protein